MPPQVSDVLRDATFLAHRYSERDDVFHFLPVSRDVHRACTFITDEYLPKDLPYQSFTSQQIASESINTAPLHFIFHSAYCCSTLLARALDVEGTSMGLKEPVILNDIVGWRRRGALKSKWSQTLDQSLDLLSRPFGHDKAVIIKPSTICNPLAEDMMTLRPDATALLLYAPIDSFLLSIAKKNMWGRLWARKLLTGAIDDGYAIGGFSQNEWLELTDLQVAAICWLSQHALFQKLIDKFGPDKVQTLDSDTLLARPQEAITALSDHFNLQFNPNEVEDILKGPAFNSHSKSNTSYDTDARARERKAEHNKHAEEISMVAQWAVAVAQSQNIKIDIGVKLIS